MKQSTIFCFCFKLLNRIFLQFFLLFDSLLLAVWKWQTFNIYPQLGQVIWLDDIQYGKVVRMPINPLDPEYSYSFLYLTLKVELLKVKIVSRMKLISKYSSGGEFMSHKPPTLLSEIYWKYGWVHNLAQKLRRIFGGKTE